MLFKYKIKYFDDLAIEHDEVKGIVGGDDFSDVVEALVEHYTPSHNSSWHIEKITVSLVDDEKCVWEKPKKDIVS